MVSWGGNNHGILSMLQLIFQGSLGDGSQHDRLIPGFADNRKFYTSQIESLVANEEHVLVLANGKVYVFGKNNGGELGDCKCVVFICLNTCRFFN